jgi:hypothetical protein
MENKSTFFGIYGIAMVTALLIVLSSHQVCSQKTVLKSGISFSSAMSNLNVKRGASLDFAALFSVSKRHYLGGGVDFMWWNGKSTAIHIPDNLMSSETVTPGMNMITMTLINYIDLTPDKHVKVFAGNKTGFFSADYNVIHGGVFILVPTSEEVYSRKTSGIITEFSLSLYVPFSKKENAPVGMELKSAAVTGSKVHYGIPVVRNVDGVDTIGIRESSGSPTSWCNTISIFCRF